MNKECITEGPSFQVFAGAVQGLRQTSSAKKMEFNTYENERKGKIVRTFQEEIKHERKKERRK